MLAKGVTAIKFINRAEFKVAKEKLSQKLRENKSALDVEPQDQCTCYLLTIKVFKLFTVHFLQIFNYE